MNAITSFFFKSWIRCALALVALGAVLMAVQHAISRHPHPAVPGVSPAPQQETHALPDPAADAELPQVVVPVAAAPKESSPVSDGANVDAPVPPSSVAAPGQETFGTPTISSQATAPPLARAVSVGPSPASVGVGSSGNSETPRLDPPLVFAVDPKNLTPLQQAAVASIQDQFLKTVGDPNQNPDDPAYAKNWTDAQAKADQSYKLFFGYQAFSQMQLKRAMNSYSEIQSP